jgi:glycosyltransferase involved in cell wall biosynthesis
MAAITILTPTLNRPLRVLERCMASVNQQTVADWEHVVCSDGRHEPGVEAIVARAYDRRRRYLHLPETRGHFGAGVRGALLPAVVSRYVAFLDDDNLLFPRFCERMVAALAAHPHAGFAICQIVHAGPLHPRFGPPPAILRGIPPVTGNIDTLQVVARTEAIQQVGWVLNGYGSDGATYERLAAAFPWVAVEEVLGLHL